MGSVGLRRYDLPSSGTAIYHYKCTRYCKIYLGLERKYKIIIKKYIYHSSILNKKDASLSV